MWHGLLSKRMPITADGWFEWTGEAGDKQPWLIHGQDGAPLLMAAITAWQPGKDDDVEHSAARDCIQMTLGYTSDEP